MICKAGLEISYESLEKQSKVARGTLELRCIIYLVIFKDLFPLFALITIELQ